VLTLTLLLVTCAIATAQQSEREVAEWAIRLGGGVTLEMGAEPVRDLSRLPAGDLRILGLDFTGTLVTPEDLPKLKALTAIRELFFPAYMWNQPSGQGSCAPGSAHRAARAAIGADADSRNIARAVR
jgi:hypothetical protein